MTDNHIYSGNVAKPVDMTFMRVVCFALGGIGIGLAAFIWYASGKFTAFLIFGPLLGLPLILAWAAWPRHWFESAAKDTADSPSRYRKYTPLEMTLLAAMALAALPIIWALQYLPPDIRKDFDFTMVLGIVGLATATTAYSWQMKISVGRAGVGSSLILLGIGATIIFGGGASNPGDSFMGYVFVYMSVWSLLRTLLMRVETKPAALVPKAAVPVHAENNPARPAPAGSALERTFRNLPVTMSIIVVLSCIFTLELLFGIGSPTLSAPSLHTMVAFGALNHSLVLESHEWYRLFSAALLHANLLHLLFNAYALFLVGVVLEKFIGSAWFFAVFTLGALGGSLMSLEIDPDYLISLGASGAIMALFAAAYVTSFRRPDDDKRKKLQKGLIQILVLSLIPVLGFGGGRIDIAAHLGGALTGGFLGLILYVTWDTQRQKPRLTEFASVVSMAGVLGFAYTAYPAIQQYPKYVEDAKLHPESTQRSSPKVDGNDTAFDAAKRGWNYERGDGVPKDYAKAVALYQQAAAGGNLWAQANLGRMYQYGRGVPVDYALAMKWYLSAAARGEPMAEEALGFMYENGLGVTQDYGQALSWFQKSAAQGSSEGEAGLGHLYVQGLGVQQDYAQAFAWYQRSADQGNDAAEDNLGWLYENGDGVKQDYAQALIWYRKAVAQDEMYAELSLGVMYAKGRGVTQDYGQAFALTQKSAQQGLPDAQEYLGYLYENGLGVPVDVAMAAKWYTDAAKQGNKTAAASLARLGAPVP